MSTNKVYGDAPHRLNLAEGETRWDYADPEYADGIKETFAIDKSMQSIFGASKVAADAMGQEYGRYFQMPTCCLRAGCLTGPNHSGVDMDENRRGDHICYISDLSKMKALPKMGIIKNLKTMFEEISQFLAQTVRESEHLALITEGHGKPVDALR